MYISNIIYRANLSALVDVVLTTGIVFRGSEFSLILSVMCLMCLTLFVSFLDVFESCRINDFCNPEAPGFGVNVF